MINLSLFKGPGVAIGLLVGLVLGILTGKIVTFILLGLLFGIFAEDEYDAEHRKPQLYIRDKAGEIGTSGE